MTTRDQDKKIAALLKKFQRDMEKFDAGFSVRANGGPLIHVTKVCPFCRHAFVDLTSHIKKTHPGEKS